VDSEYVRNMISDLLKISVGKIRVPNKMPDGGWTVTDVTISDKPLNPEQSQIVGDILFWQQWWVKGMTKCPKCNHRLSIHTKLNETRAECLSSGCNCICEIDTGVYIRDGDTAVMQALSKLRGRS
jgi:hypothetical protein